MPDSFSRRMILPNVSLGLTQAVWLLLALLTFGCQRESNLEPELIAAAAKSEWVTSTRPLITPDLASSKKLMESLDAASLGIDFRHEWKPSNRYEQLLLKTGFTGGGVCMGDYDGDGLTDVLLTRPHGGLQLYRNLGDFKFENKTEAAGLSCEDHWTTGAAWVDLNQDHRLDLVVCSYESPNLVFLNEGAGKFREIAKQVGLDFQGASVKIAWADFDNDGDLDGYLTTNRIEPKTQTQVKYLGSRGNYRVAPEFLEQVGVLTLPTGEQKFFKAGQADHLFKNLLKETGELRFTDVSKAAKLDGYYHGLDVTWWDANGDGWPDLYVANDFTDPDRFYLNNGDGTFTDNTLSALPSTPWFTMGAAFADINRDGRLDLLATDMAGTSHYRQKMSMGNMDALAWFLDWTEPRQHMRNALFLNTGTDRFLEIAQAAGLANSDWTWSVKLADLDNDGFEDAFMTNGFTRDYLDSDFNLRLKQSGKRDPLAWYKAPILKEKNLAFRNQRSARDRVKFENVSEQWGVDSLGISFGAAFGDLDNDGDLDLIVNNFDAAPSVYRNGSPVSANRLKLALRGIKSNSQGYGAVIRAGEQMRWFNPHNGYMSSNDPFVYFGLGKQEIVPEVKIRWPSGTVQTLTNVVANQLITVVEQDSGKTESLVTDTQAPAFFEQSETLARAQHVERPFNDYQQQPLLPNKLSQLGPGMAWGDVNGDQIDDLFLGGAAGQAGQLLLADGAGGFLMPDTRPFLAAAEAEDMGCLFIDVDSDGDRDLLVVSGGVEAGKKDEQLRDRLYLNQGLASDNTVIWEFAQDRLPDLRESGGPITANDFDRDGDLDLFIGSRVLPGDYPLSSPSRLLVNHQGKFQDETKQRCADLLEAGMVTSALWCDVNSDGWCDLVTASEYGPVRLYLNQEGTLRDHTPDAGLADLLGWWNGLAVSDIDADGDLDLIASNFGDNIKYHPSHGHPQIIFFNDFDGSGKTRIVEAKSTGTALLPVRGRSCSSNAMPILRERFDSYHSFASATLQDIYSQDNLDAALQLEANVLTSCLLLNDGTGHFEMQPLPPMAQAAPAFGAAFLETGQLYPSLFVAQNFFSPQRETGRMNGAVGTLMKYDPSDGYRGVWPDRSGIVIPEDAKAAAAVDVNQDGWQDLVVTLNNGIPRCFAQRPPSSAVPFALKLIGPNGNQDGVGTHVTAIFDGGRRAIRCMGAGEGYLTQLPARLYWSQRPNQIEVCWPDGTRSSHDIAADGSPFQQIAHPSLNDKKFD
ncbi:MAG: hypothetical protein GY768_17180 [Planctomycetaceae bacterium]|nr:hypothetical protein [Planctomycetaceae bacterium]